MPHTTSTSFFKILFYLEICAFNFVLTVTSILSTRFEPLQLSRSPFLNLVTLILQNLFSSKHNYFTTIHRFFIN